MKDDFPTPLARVLYEQGRRQEWLARMTGIHFARISNWARGAGYPPGERNARKVADALGLKVSDLWPDRPSSDERRAA
jgi:transcriptional regulator with XRE-family HTH domain